MEKIKIRPCQFAGSEVTLDPRYHVGYLRQIPGGGDTPIHYLYGYVLLNGVVVLKLLIYPREMEAEGRGRRRKIVGLRAWFCAW